MGLLGLFRRKPHERAGFALYTAAVGAARDPALFGDLGVPDTLDGRFDLINLYTGLLVRRLRAETDPRGAALAQAVFDAMFADMDMNLREMGVSDLVVGRRVKNMWEAFHGRAVAYEAAIDAGDQPALALALARNVWRGVAPGAVGESEALVAGAPAERLATLAIAQAKSLAAQPLATLLRGEVQFQPVPA
ncbi:MAG: ubiquinol-cytochrome C chaperone family protein [Pseudomonadota bacterium]